MPLFSYVIWRVGLPEWITAKVTDPELLSSNRLNTLYVLLIWFMVVWGEVRLLGHTSPEILVHKICPGEFFKHVHKKYGWLPEICTTVFILLLLGLSFQNRFPCKYVYICKFTSIYVANHLCILSSILLSDSLTYCRSYWNCSFVIFIPHTYISSPEIYNVKNSKTTSIFSNVVGQLLIS